MRKYVLSLVILTCCVSVGSSQFPLTKKEMAARKVAEGWLPLLDAYEYGQSWEELSPLAKKAIKKAHWEIGLTQLRSPLGKLKTRSFFSADYMKPLKGQPKREQLRVRFMSHFENGSILESVATIHDKDGKWRVTTYMRIPPK